MIIVIVTNCWWSLLFLLSVADHCYFYYLLMIVSPVFRWSQAGLWLWHWLWDRAWYFWQQQEACWWRRQRWLWFLWLMGLALLTHSGCMFCAVRDQRSMAVSGPAASLYLHMRVFVDLCWCVHTLSRFSQVSLLPISKFTHVNMCWFQ